MANENEGKHDESLLLSDALLALANQTGIAGRVIALHPQASSTCEADAVIEFETEAGRSQYIIECKSSADRKSLIAHVKSRFFASSQPGVLVVPYISREMAEYCRELDLQFLDTHGNAYLHAPGMYVYVKGEKSARGVQVQKVERSINNATALRVLFGLLCQPTMLQAPYREIAQSAGVSLGSIVGIFDDMKNRGMMVGDAKHDRRLLEPVRLLDEWVINYPAVLRPKLALRRFSAVDPDWWQGVELASFDAMWGGEVAAQRLTNYLVPVTQTIYVDPAKRRSLLNDLIGTYRLKPDVDGSIEILDRFWNFSDDTQRNVTPPILVYADLMATFDPRCREVATMIREHEIDNAFPFA